MRNVFKRYIHYAQNYFNNHLLYFSHHFNRRKFIDEKGTICIDIKSNIYRRHLANLIFWFVKEGYQVSLKHRFTAIGSMKFHLQNVFKLPGFKINCNIPKNTNLVLTSRNNQLKENELYLNPEYFIVDSYYHVPLGMHPALYFNNYYKLTKKLQKNTKRDISVFFSGNMNPAAYNRDVIEKNFKKISRKKIAELLINKFPKEQIIFPQNRGDLESGNQNRVVFNDKNIVSISQKDFLPFLSKCNFFLCTPGVIHPICHNNFEAMSVGTILILQYSEYFYPNLVHGKNCLTFKDEYDLIEVIKYALKMPEEKISKMRMNVIEYYNKYFTPKSIVNNIFHRYKNGEKMIYLGPASSSVIRK